MFSCVARHYFFVRLSRVVAKGRVGKTGYAGGTNRTPGRAVSFRRVTTTNNSLSLSRGFCNSRSFSVRSFSGRNFNNLSRTKGSFRRRGCWASVPCEFLLNASCARARNYC